jgi:hypothetical protein
MAQSDEECRYCKWKEFYVKLYEFSRLQLLFIVLHGSGYKIRKEKKAREHESWMMSPAADEAFGGFLVSV